MTQSQLHQRKMAALLVGALGVALVGFFAGIGRRGIPEGTTLREELDSTAPLARSNAELATNPWKSGQSTWTAPGIPPRTPVSTANEQARAKALERRAQLRAFEGAPPTIPHPVDQGSAKECRACHQHGAQIGKQIAPAWSHREYSMCTQCHVPRSAPIPVAPEELSDAARIGSDFEGRYAALAPFRWGPGSPPQIPHSRLMRERCDSCHGASGKEGLQSSHPERQNCEQCHTTAARHDQRGRP